MVAMNLPDCRLIGTLDGPEGNVFVIIAKVAGCLSYAGFPEKAYEFRRKAMSCKSYNAVLELCLEYVHAV